MAMGIPALSGAFQINAGMIGGILTGSADEYFSLPISGAGTLNGAQAPAAWITAAGPRRQLSASFSSNSGSVIMALNFLKASISDAEEVTFGEVNTALAAATGTITLGNSSNAEDVNFAAALSGAGGISGQALTAANKFKVTSLGNVSSSEAAHFVKAVTGLSFAASSSLIAKTTVSGAGGLSGKTLTIANEEIVTELGAVAALTSVTAVTTISGGGAISGQNATFNNKFKVTTTGQVSSSQAAHFVLAVTGLSFAASSSLVAKTTVSGAGGIQGKSLTIGDETIVTELGAVVATTSVVATTTVSGAGQASAKNLVLANGTWNAAGTVSGAGGVSAASLTINNVAIVTQAGAIVAPTTLSSAADISGRSVIIEGTDSLENVVPYKISVAGGILTVVEQ